MGQFSWLDCRTREQIVDNKKRDVYVLVPKEFEDKYGEDGRIKEICYDGYGRFGGYDIYDLIPEWNKEFIPIMLAYAEKGRWTCGLSKDDIQNLKAFYEGKEITCPKRYLGILMACYDDDNRKLFYPIKITHNKYVTYEGCEPSLRDPNQGWEQ